jgi:tripeptide aminopeptidase
MEKSTLRILDLAIAIQQIPAPTFYEGERAEFVRAKFSECGLADVQIDATGNVYGRMPGRGDSNRLPLVISAHLDTVFPTSVDLHYEREAERVLAPGIGDNSLGVAGLTGLKWALEESNISPAGDLWLVANVCEEGLGDLRGIRAVVDRFGGGVQAYLVLEGMSLGQIYHRGLGVKRYRISIQTSGGHSWIDYGKPSAIHELTALSTRLAALELPRNPRTTLNIGVISGGSSVNTIAAEAMLELDLRSESAETLEGIAREAEQIVQSAEKPEITVQMKVIGQRPSGEIPVGHPLIKLAQSCLREVGIEPRLNIGSTDGNLPLSLGYPAITIGLTTGGRAHTVHEFINTVPLEKGMKQLVILTSKVWELRK